MVKPFIPETGKSGAAVGMSFFVYRNTVVEGIARLGGKHPEGIDAFARQRYGSIQVNYDLGVSPEDTARDLFETFLRNRPYYDLGSDQRVIHEACERARKEGRWNL